MLAAIAFSLALSVWRFAPPAPIAATAPTERFSAERAATVLHTLLDEVASHPTGSAANDEVRSRIRERFAELGYTATEESRVACAHGSCMQVTNVFAQLDGGEDVVLVAAHYDSVGAGPGASDDGIGVAVVLEVARAMRGQRPHNTVVFLLTDGEEMGLLGADHFMHSPLGDRVKAIVNVDNRGTSGPSLMFETAGPTSELVPLLREVPRPLTSSLFGGVYELLPNDTDFTLFRSRGAVGFNFAVIGDVAHYHTDRDNLQNASPASIQHHGDNILGLTRALQDRDLRALSRGERAVYFDWLGVMVLAWPETHSLLYALLGLLLLVVAVALSWRTDQRALIVLSKHIGWSLVWLVVPVVLAGLLVVGVVVTRSAPFPLHAELALPVATTACVAAVMLFAIGPSLSRGAFWLRYAAGHLLLALCAVVVSIVFPPASHLFVAPLIVAAVVAVIGAAFRVRGWERAVLTALSVLVTSTLWFRVAIGIASAVNVSSMPIIAVALALVLAPAAMALPKSPRASLPYAALATLIGVAATLLYPAYDEDSPQRMSIVHFEVDDQNPEWWVDATWGAPPSVMPVAFEGRSPPPLPILGMWRVARAPAPSSGASKPTLEVLSSDVESGRRTVRAHLRSPRGADVFGFIIDADTSVTVHGRGLTTTPGADRFAGRGVTLIRGAPPSGVNVTIQSRGRPEVILFDVRRELGPAGKTLIEARGSTGVPSQEGDLSIVGTHVRL